MIGLLDPMMLTARAADLAKPEKHERELEQDIRIVLETCRKRNIALVPLNEYWEDLWRIGVVLERSLSRREAKSALQELRKYAERWRDYSLPPLPSPVVGVWQGGFAQMFTGHGLAKGWDERMARAIVRAVLSSNEVVVFCRRVSNRNLRIHGAGSSTLHENTRWTLYVQPSVPMPCRVLCVHHPRNLDEQWTARFDWRLPAASDGARYPFCLPDQWWKGSTVAVRTIASKPAWADAHGNGWTRPNIPNGAGHHWDVFIQDARARERIGVDQINVAEFGSSDRGKRAGDIHHIPTDKEGLVNDVGWAC